MEVKIEAFQVIDREVKSAGTSAHVYLPKAWEGRKVKILLVEPLEEKI